MLGEIKTKIVPKLSSTKKPVLILDSMPVQIMFILIYAITAAYLLFLTPEHTVIDDESHILKNSLIQFKRIINLCAFLACIILARVFTMSNK